MTEYIHKQVVVADERRGAHHHHTQVSLFVFVYRYTFVLSLSCEREKESARVLVFWKLAVVTRDVVINKLWKLMSESRRRVLMRLSNEAT